MNFLHQTLFYIYSESYNERSAFLYQIEHNTSFEVPINELVTFEVIYNGNTVRIIYSYEGNIFCYQNVEVNLVLQQCINHIIYVREIREPEIEDMDIEDERTDQMLWE